MVIDSDSRFVAGSDPTQKPLFAGIADAGGEGIGTRPEGRRPERKSTGSEPGQSSGRMSYPPGLSQREVLARAFDEDLSRRRQDSPSVDEGGSQRESRFSYPRSEATPTTQPKDPMLAVAESMQAMAKAVSDSAVSRSETIKREADSVKVPPIPKPTEVKSWERSVHSAVMAASGNEAQDKVAEWLFVCNQATSTPDQVFSPEACPRGFASLDTKLGVALDAAIRACNNNPLKQHVERLQRARQEEAKAPWGGRRLMWELLSFSACLRKARTGGRLLASPSFSGWGTPMSRWRSGSTTLSWHVRQPRRPACPMITLSPVSKSAWKRRSVSGTFSRLGSRSKDGRGPWTGVSLCPCTAIA